MADSKRRPKVLVVEDDSDLLNSYKMAFTGDGRIDGHFTDDGGHAAALLRSEPFDAAVIDVRMPTMNGLQVVEVARSSEHNRNLPILVLSSLPSAETRSRLQQLSSVKVFEKPIKPADLIFAIFDMTRSDVSRSTAYDARILNAILLAMGSALSERFGDGLAKMGKPGVRKSVAPRRHDVAALTLSCGMTSGTLSLSGDAAFGRAVAGTADASSASVAGAASTVGLLAQVALRLEPLLADVSASTRIGQAFFVEAGDPRLAPAAGGGAILVFPFAVASSLVELEVSLARQEQESVQADGGASFGSLEVE